MDKSRQAIRYGMVVMAALLVLPLVSCDIPGSGKSEKKKSIQAPPVPPPSVHDLITDGDTTGFIDWLFNTDNINERHPLDQASPLITAVRANQPMYVKDLLERGADPDIATASGTTALHAAAEHDRSDIVRVLLSAGANPTLMDQGGRTAQDLALSLGYDETARQLAEGRETYLASLEAKTVDQTEPEEEAISPAVLLSTDFRVWTSQSGSRLDAAFIQNVFDTVVLQNREGTLVRIQLNRLIPEDQVLVRKLSGIDPHALARARGAPVKSSRSIDSLSLRMGKSSGWTVLENCRLLKNSSNDGDSFHVQHDGKEYIFRLYFVDAAETNDDFPDRVKEQADYFNLSPAAALRLGKEAARFSSSLLASSPFTVLTRWEDARGNSSLPRYYALVVTPLGDLDELLTREGLVRQYGMNVDSNLGAKKNSVLRKLEHEAKQQESGAWLKSDDQARTR